MIFVSLLFALTAPANEPVESATKLTAVKGLSVTIPTEIGSAIKPYIDCLVAADNAAIGEGINSDGDAMRAISAKSRVTCLPVRQSAEANAAKLLERYPERSAEERSTMIESAMVSAESLSESLAAIMDKYKSNAEATEKSNAPNN